MYRQLFASVLKMTKSRDFLSVALKGQAFKPYKYMWFRFKAGSGYGLWGNTVFLKSLLKRVPTPRRKGTSVWNAASIDGSSNIYRGEVCYNLYGELQRMFTAEARS